MTAADDLVALHKKRTDQAIAEKNAELRRVEAQVARAKQKHDQLEASLANLRRDWEAKRKQIDEALRILKGGA